MRYLSALAIFCAGAALAQDAAKPSASELIDKHIASLGGRAAMEKITSTVSKSTVDITFAGATATAEFYAQAPNKFAAVIKVDGYGDVYSGTDGAIAWDQRPDGSTEIKGEMLEQAKRDAIFNAPLKWREVYPTIEVTGKEKVGEREAWAVVFTPKTGKPETRYFDVADMTLLREAGTRIGPQGEYQSKRELSDYREVNGVKMPFKIVQNIEMGDLVYTMTEIKANVPIEDAKFKPAP